MGKKTQFAKVLLLSVSISFVACNADVNLQKISGDISIDPSLVVPLGGASVSLGDILDSAKINGIIYDNNTTLINYIISDTLPDYILPKIDFIDNIKMFSKNLQIPYSPIPIPANTDILTQEYNEFLDFGINSDTTLQRIDKVHVSNAIFSIKVSVYDFVILPSNLMFSFSFADKMIMDNGSSNEITFMPTIFNAAEDKAISNFNILFSNAAKGIPFKISLKAKTGNLPVTINPSSKISIEFSFKQLNWTVVYGKFDLSQIPIEGKIDLNLNSILPKSLSIEISNPQIEITTVSNLGVKIGLNLDYLKSISATGTTFARFDGKTTAYNEFRYKPEKPNDIVTNSLPKFDSKWGEINKLLLQKPDSLAFKLSAKSVKTVTPDFITPDAKIKVLMKSTIPMEFSGGSNFTYTDSIDNFFKNLASEIDKFSLIDYESSKLILNIYNSLPIKTSLSISFIDSNGKEIVTDFERNYSFDAGQVDENGIVKVGRGSNTILAISLGKDQLSQIRKAVKIYYKVKIEGKDVNSKLGFSRNDFLNLKLGVIVKGNYKLNFSK